MKYLGLIVDDKDIVTKEYVDSHTSRPTYKQTFTASGTYNMAYIDIPYVESYSVEDLLNAKIYYFSANRVCEADNFYVSKYKKNGVDVWRYAVYFGMSCESGSTVVFENMFTDTDAEYTGLASM